MKKGLLRKHCVKAKNDGFVCCYPHYAENEIYKTDIRQVNNNDKKEFSFVKQIRKFGFT
jgi:hypothetical protein